MPFKLISLKSLFQLSTRPEKRFYILWNRIQERRQLILFSFLLLFYIVFFYSMTKVYFSEVKHGGRRMLLQTNKLTQNLCIPFVLVSLSYPTSCLSVRIFNLVFIAEE